MLAQPGLKLDETTSLRTAIANRQPGWMLPAFLYTSQEAYDVDCAVIFTKHWIAVGVECDVEEPGDVIALDIGPSSIVIVRGDDDELRAFHNVCAHRGSRLLPSGRHVVGKLVCPYHQWTYDLDGSLVRAQHMGVDFERDLHHLKPVHLRSIGGILYACLDDNPPDDIAELDRIATPRLATYDLANCKVAHEQEIIEEGNWKLSMENNRECYHCGANHPDLNLSFHAVDFGFDPAALSDSEQREVEELANAYKEAAAYWEAHGLEHAPIEHTLGKATNFRTQRLIVAGEGESQTPDTKAASSIPLGKMDMPNGGDLHLWGVNSWNHIMSDHAVITAIYPLGPNKTLLRTKWLVHKDAVEGEDYDLEHLTDVWVKTNLEDAHLVAQAQAGVASAGFRPGPYSRFIEQSVDDFATWYTERMAFHGYSL